MPETGDKMKCKHCGSEIEDKKTVVIDGWEYTTEDEQKGKSFKEIIIPKGWELWTAQDCIELSNNHKKELNLKDCWFFVEQPFKQNNSVAWFFVNSDNANLSCDYYDPGNSNDGLGVRFKRRIKCQKQEKNGNK